MKKNINYDYNYHNIYGHLKGVNIINKAPKIKQITGKENKLESLFIASNIHKNVRKDIQKMFRPGVSIYEISKIINNKIREYCNYKGINCGIAFPPVLSVNNCIAHYSPTKETDIKLSFDDNIKVDIGVHVNGWIIDSAFTIYFNSKHDKIHKITKEALYAGIKEIGIDAPISNVSKAIQEVVESNDFTVINGIGGHSIEHNNIHGDIFISNKKQFSLSLNTPRFKEGLYAVEPFVSYKTNEIYYDTPDNNYILKLNNNNYYRYFNNYIFSDNHIKYYNINKSNLNNIVKKYPAIYIKNDIGVQYEHTIYLTNNKKCILSQYDDY